AGSTVRRSAADGVPEPFDLRASALGKIPARLAEQSFSAHCKIEVFRIGLNALIERRTDDADEIALAVVNGATAIAWTYRSRNLQDAILGARNDSGAEGEFEALGMADYENLFAIARRGHGLHERGAAGVAREPDQRQIQVPTSGDDVRAGPHTGFE